MSLLSDLIALRHNGQAPALHQTMRIAGEMVDNARRIEVFNPYSGALIGSVPKATLADVQQAFGRAKQYKSKLTCCAPPSYCAPIPM